MYLEKFWNHLWRECELSRVRRQNADSWLEHPHRREGVAAATSTLVPHRRDVIDSVHVPPIKRLGQEAFLCRLFLLCPWPEVKPWLLSTLHIEHFLLGETLHLRVLACHPTWLLPVDGSSNCLRLDEEHVPSLNTDVNHFRGFRAPEQARPPKTGGSLPPLQYQSTPQKIRGADKLIIWVVYFSSWEASPVPHGDIMAPSLSWSGTITEARDHLKTRKWRALRNCSWTTWPSWEKSEKAK